MKRQTKANFKGEVLLEKFKLAVENKTDIVEPLKIRSMGVAALQESESPSYAFTKAGVDLSDRRYITMPASFANPGIRLHGSAITSGEIADININTFSALTDVLYSDILTFNRLPAAFKQAVGKSWEDKLFMTVQEQQIKNKMYQMLLGGVDMDYKEEAVTVHSLVKYIASMSSTFRTLLKRMGIDLDDMLAVNQAWHSADLSEFVRFRLARNPYMHATNRAIVDGYNEHIRNFGTTDLSQFGAKIDVVEDAQNFTVFSAKGATLASMAEFMASKKAGREIMRAATKTIAEETGRAETSVKPRVHLTHAQLTTKRKLEALVYEYSRTIGVSEPKAWSIIDGMFNAKYGVSFMERYREFLSAGNPKKSIAEFAALTNSAEYITQFLTSIFGRESIDNRVILTPNFGSLGKQRAVSR